MQYIAAVSGSTERVNRVKDQLLQSNPVLEAFGNACTTRNDNSSRFGKYMDIQFDFKGDPVGGQISNYLLEKSRVVYQADGERNFHILYQVFAGGLVPGKPEDYHYLNQSGVTKVKTIDDKADFVSVRNALKVIGFREDEIKNLFNIVAGIIVLGNINFERRGDGSGVATKDTLAKAAELLGIEAGLLEHSLTERTVAARGEAIKKPADVGEAAYARDAFAKGIYDRAFSWLVQRINSNINFKAGYGEETRVIGVLDIYGFEIFENNSFEQFCINYCNEKLQQLFIELTLKTEQEEYQREGIEWEEVKYFNNAIICELIDMNATGIIAQIDDECLRPGDATDSTLLERLNNRFKGHAHYESRETSRSDKSLHLDMFRLKHYAGEVSYNVKGFLDKNIDSLFRDLKHAGYSSTNPIVHAIFPDGEAIKEASKRPVTAGTAFKQSLAELVANLMTKNPHYVRCIKPNNKKSPGIFDQELCTHQVRYLGLLENVRVRRAGFAYRQTFETWLERYKALCPKTWPSYKGPAKDGVALIMKEMRLGPDDYRLGKTKVFIRSPKTLFDFEEARESKFSKMAVIVQTAYRGWIARKKWKKLKAAIKIQLKWRSYKSKKYFHVLFAAYKDVKSRPDYGKSIKMPPPPSVLERFGQLFLLIHKNWRARMMIMALTPAQRALVRRKVFTHTLFKGKKPFDVNKKVDGDYISQDAAHASAFSNARSTFLAAGRDQEVLFASFATKVSRKCRNDARAFVLGDGNLYKLDAKSFKIHKEPIPLKNVTGIAVSSKKDSVVVFNLTGGFDVVLDLGIGSGTEKVRSAGAWAREGPRASKH